MPKYSSDARNVVPRVESIPTSIKVRLEPAREVHRRVRRRHADIAEVPRAIASRDVHASAKSNCQMRHVSANPRAFMERFPGCLGWPGKLVPESDLTVHIIADCLHARPTLGRISEQIPCCLREAVRFTITAAQKKR